MEVDFAAGVILDAITRRLPFVAFPAFDDPAKPFRFRAGEPDTAPSGRRAACASIERNPRALPWHCRYIFMVCDRPL